MKSKEDCPLCQALINESNKFLYEDDEIVILQTKTMKGHHKRVMLVSKGHSRFMFDENWYVHKFFRAWCQVYFDEEPTFVICESAFSTVKNHWHVIACDWYGTEKEIEQLHYTPHTTYETNIEWSPK